MEKLQILLPMPQMHRLRLTAQRLDTPMSDIIRRAVEIYLERFPERDLRSESPKIPTFAGGKILVGAKHLRDMAYAERLEAHNR